MSAVLSAMVPIFALIVIGFMMRRYGPYGDGFWVPAERLNYFVLFPALIVGTLAQVELEEIEIWPMAGAMLAAVLLVAAGTYALRRLLPLPGPSFASLFQGATRINAYIAIAGALGLYDSAGMTLIAVGLAVIIPLVNVLSVLVLSAHGAGAAMQGHLVLGQILRNPIILACVAGVALNLFGITLPSPSVQFLELLGRAALPLGLLSVGAGLDLATVGGALRPLALAGTLKLLVLPGLTALFCALLGVHGATAAVAVLFNACPSSASSYILARQLGGDHRLMAGIITTQTLAAMVTLPMILMLF